MKKLFILAGTVIFLLTASIAVAANVTFRWDANTETDLAKYKLYQAETVGGPYVKAQPICRIMNQVLVMKLQTL